VTGTLGIVFLLAATRTSRGKTPVRPNGPMYLLAYLLLAVVTAGMVWLPFATFGSGHGNPLVVVVVAGWPFSLYRLYRLRPNRA
jgi:hypothetical protein